MATNITKVALTGATNTLGIEVSATSVGTTIHTGHTTTSIIDEVWLYGQNNRTAAVTVWIQWGSTATSAQMAIDVAPQDGPQLLVPGLLLTGQSAGLVISAFASASQAVMIYGYVNRIS